MNVAQKTQLSEKKKTHSNNLDYFTPTCVPAQRLHAAGNWLAVNCPGLSPSLWWCPQVLSVVNGQSPTHGQVFADPVSLSLHLYLVELSGR